MPKWTSVSGASLEQGDYIRGLLVPIYGDDFPAAAGPYVAKIKDYDVIVLTQTCDLANSKASQVLMCSARPVKEIALNSAINKNFWLDVKKGRREAYHLLHPFAGDNFDDCILVNFFDVFSLPLAPVIKHASGIGPRHRLCSPYLEDLSHRFGRFFARVALPDPLPSP